MVAKRKGVSRLIAKGTRRCPPPVPPQRGTHRVAHQKIDLLVCLAKRSAKTGWQCRPALK